MRMLSVVCSTQATKQFLSSVNGVNNGGATVSWTTAVKFLMARKFNVKRAIELYWAHEVRRKRTNMRGAHACLGVRARMRFDAH